MIRSYNDHAANERTFLAWVRTGLSSVALGIVVKKGSLIAMVMAGASSPALSGSMPDYLSDYGAPVLLVTGIAALVAGAVRFVRTALRIDDQHTHVPGIVRLASALQRRGEDSPEVACASAKAGPAANDGRNRLSGGAGRINLSLAGRTDVSGLRRKTAKRSTCHAVRLGQ
jgi:putative membrane protein